MNREDRFISMVLVMLCAAAFGVYALHGWSMLVPYGIGVLTGCFVQGVFFYLQRTDH
jgi:hypothetical protein